MDLDFTEEQIMFRNSAREFMSRECPTAAVRELEESQQGYSPKMWHSMAELGWLGLCLPEGYGGIGGDWIDMVILYDEMGRAAFPSPHLATVVMGGQAILSGGTEEQKLAFLPKIASGEVLFSLAHAEPGFRYRPRDVTTAAVLSGNDYVINGTKLFVPNANVADYICVSAATEEGVALFLVDSGSPGVECTPLKTISEIGHEKQSEIALSDVKVKKSGVIGNLGDGSAVLSRVMDLATIALCAEMVGGAQAALQMTVEYAKERTTFGRPIGSYQALQHKMADMLLQVDGAWLLTYQAACGLTEGLPCDREIAMAKAWTSDAYRRVTADAIQVLGAYGCCSEVDTTIYYRRAKAAEIAFGGARHHRQIVASEIGL